jgi:serine/threonine protein phosphatase Stp1
VSLDLPAVVVVPLGTYGGGKPCVSGVELTFAAPIETEEADSSRLVHARPVRALLSRYESVQAERAHAHPLILLLLQSDREEPARRIGSGTSVQLWLAGCQSDECLSAAIGGIIASLQFQRRATIAFAADSASSVGSTYARNMDASSVVRFSIRGCDGVVVTVADGVGSQDAGDLAARIAVAVASEIPARLARPDQPGLDSLVIEQFARIRTALREQALATHQGPVDDTSAVFRASTLATTVVGAVVLEDVAWIWWAGDSRAYRLRDGVLQLLTRDHSVGVRRKGLDGETVTAPEDRYLTFVAAPSYDGDCDLARADVAEGDVLLLCSDGISEDAPLAYLESLLNSALARGLSSRETCEFLIEERWGQTTDNMTAAIVFAGTPRTRFSNVSVPQSIATFRGLSPQVIHHLNTWMERGAEPPPGLFMNSWKVSPAWLCRRCGQWAWSDSVPAECPSCLGEDLQTDGLLAVYRRDGFVTIHPIGSNGEISIGTGLAGGTEPQMAEVHAHIRGSAGGWTMCDLDSPTGLWKRTCGGPMFAGELLRVGDTLLTLLPPSANEGRSYAGT